MSNELEKYFKLKDPYFHLIAIDASEFNIFVQEFKEKFGGRGYITLIEGVKSVNLDKLYNEFSKAYEFPGYFGYSWPAFDECMNDLDWLIDIKSFVLFISDIDQLLASSDVNFNTFIKIINSCVKEWTGGRDYNSSFPTSPTPFHVIFQCSNYQVPKIQVKLAKAGLDSFDWIAF